MQIELLKKTITTEDIGKAALLEIDTNKLKKFENGEFLDCKIARDRRYEKLQSYWASCQMIAENHKLPEYEYLELDTREKIDFFTRVKCGLIECVIVGKNQTVIKPLSISYDKMSDEVFEDYFYAKAVPLWEKISGISARDILVNWELYKK